MSHVIDYPMIKVVRTPAMVRELEERKSRSVWLAWYAAAFQNRMAAQWQEVMKCEAGSVSMTIAECFLFWVGMGCLVFAGMFIGG